MKNEAATTRSEKREKRVKTRGFWQVSEETSRENDEKASPEPPTRGFRNAWKRVVFATFSKKRQEKRRFRLDAKIAKNAWKRVVSNAFGAAESPAKCPENREKRGKTRCFWKRNVEKSARGPDTRTERFV